MMIIGEVLQQCRASFFMGTNNWRKGKSKNLHSETTFYLKRSYNATSALLLILIINKTPPMFNLFKKKDDFVKVIDKIWISEEAKWKGIINEWKKDTEIV